MIGSLPDMKLGVEFSTAASLSYSVLQTGTSIKSSLQVHFSQGSVSEGNGEKFKPPVKEILIKSTNIMHRHYSSQLEDCDHVGICWWYIVTASRAKSFDRAPIRLGPLPLQALLSIMHCKAHMMATKWASSTAWMHSWTGAHMSKCMKLKCEVDMHVVAFP